MVDNCYNAEWKLARSIIAKNNTSLNINTPQETKSPIHKNCHRRCVTASNMSCMTVEEGRYNYPGLYFVEPSNYQNAPLSQILHMLKCCTWLEGLF